MRAIGMHSFHMQNMSSMASAWQQHQRHDGQRCYAIAEMEKCILDSALHSITEYCKQMPHIHNRIKNRSQLGSHRAQPHYNSSESVCIDDQFESIMHSALHNYFNATRLCTKSDINQYMCAFDAQFV